MSKKKVAKKMTEAQVVEGANRLQRALEEFLRTFDDLGDDELNAETELHIATLMSTVDPKRNPAMRHVVSALAAMHVRLARVETDAEEALEHVDEMNGLLEDAADMLDTADALDALGPPVGDA